MGLPGPATRILEGFSTFADLPVAMTLLSPHGRVLRANAAMCALVGAAEADLLGTQALGAVDNTHRPAARADLSRLRDRNGQGRRALALVRTDGTGIDVVAHAGAVRDEAGAVALIVVHVVPAGPRADELVATALRRTAALTRLVDQLRCAVHRPDAVAQAAVAALHDVVGGGVSAFFVDPADPTVLEAAAVRTDDPVSAGELRRLYAEVPLRTDRGVFGQGCAAPGPLVLEDPWGPRPQPVLAEYASWLASHPVRRLLLVPLRWEDRVLGLLASGRHSDLPFDDAGVAYAGEVARLVAAVLADLQLLALERATVQRERVVADVVRRCEEALGEPTHVLQAVVDAVGRALGAASAAWLLDVDARPLRVVRAAASHPDPAVAELARPWLRTWAEGGTFVPRVLADGSALVVGRDQVAALVQRSQSVPEHAGALAVESLYGVRLVTRGQTVGVLAVAHPDRRLAVADRRLVDALAERIALTLDNAALLEEARSSRSRSRALVEHCSDLLLMANADGQITYASPAAARTFGGDLGRTLMASVVPQDRPLVADAWQAALARPGLSPELDVRVVDAAGRERRLSAVANNLLADPAVGGVVLTVRDVTEERAATARLAERAGQQAALAAIGATALTAELDELYRYVAKAVSATLDSTTSGVLQLLEDGRWLVVGGSHEIHLGTTLDPAPGSGLRHVARTAAPLLVEDYAVPDPSGVVEPEVVEQYGLRSGVLAPVRVGGRVWGAVTAHADRPGRFSGVDADFLHTAAAVVAGAVDRSAMSARVMAQATTDDLTGLPNRVVVQEQLTCALTGGRLDGEPVALLLLDLDDFKDVNDSLGHGAGDSVLAQLGRRLAEVVDGRGTLARLGGDEFAVVLSGDGAEECAVALADDVARSVREPFALPGLDVTLSSSTGIAVAPEHGTTAEQLLQAADMAMYRAKLERASWAVYDAELDSRRSERLSLLSELRLALSSGQLVLHYQPLVDLATERVVEVEALVRWNHPERGLLLPGAFLPTAEQTDLVHGLTRYVVRAATRQARHWRARGWKGTVSVNVSALALRETEPVEQLRDELLRARGALSVELTESALLDERARSAVQTLAGAGIACSIDDFGTGWSSLAYLRDLPVTRLKLDRAFNREVHRDAKDAAIVGSVVQLAHALGLDVVAEGVETAEVATRLRELDVDVAQGWLYGRPQAASALRLA